MVKLSAALDRVNHVFALLSSLVVAASVCALVWESVLRTFFDKPTLWAYEIVEVSVVPVLYLGLAYATQKGSHVRIDALFNRWPARFQNWMWLFIYLMGVCLGVFALWAGLNAVEMCYRYGYVTPNVEFPLGPFFIVMPIGIIFFLLQEIRSLYKSVGTLYESRDMGTTVKRIDIAGAGVCVLLVGILIAFSLGVLTPNPMVTTIIAGFMFLMLLFLGVPIAFSMGILALVWLLVARDLPYALGAMAMQLPGAIMNYALLPLPLFVLMAEVLIAGEASRFLMDGAKAVVGGVHAGLGYAVLAAGTAFAAVTGLSAASCATIGPAAMKEMAERGYNRSFSLGLVAAAGGLAVIIPPSATFILYSYIAEVSVGKLFMAGVVPGILMALGYAFVTFLRYKINPKLVPAEVAKMPLRERGVSVLRAAPVVALGLFVLISIYVGFTSVTEAAALGAAGAVILVVIQALLRRRGLKQIFGESLLNTANTLGFALFIVTMALFFGYLLSYLGVPIKFTQWVVGLGLSKGMLLLTTMVVLLVLGAVMETLTIILMIFPILLGPLLAMGFDPIWLGVLLVINLEMALTTPPFGLNIFILQGACKPWGATYMDIVRGALPYVISDGVVLVLVAFSPQLALWIPSHMTI